MLANEKLVIIVCILFEPSGCISGGRINDLLPEPTPEELAAEEKARKKRAAERAKYERRKERKRQQKLEAERQEQTVLRKKEKDLDR